MNGLIEVLSKDLGRDKIKINSIAPGVLEGGASENLSKQLKYDYLKHCSLRRYGKAIEVANMAVWFLEENSYITGKTIVLDGGL